jgi:HPt (histidine-containing phosphotransfer) domain-containing protein
VVAEFIDLFLGDLPGRLATIREGVANGDAELTRGAAHALKSSSGYIGALELSSRCRELEHTARARELALAHQLAEQVELEANRAEEFLRLHRATLDQEVVQ